MASSAWPHAILCIHVPDQIAEEGHDDAGQWEAKQERRTRENPGWESPGAPAVRPVSAGSTGINCVVKKALK